MTGSARDLIFARLVELHVRCVPLHGLDGRGAVGIHDLGFHLREVVCRSRQDVFGHARGNGNEVSPVQRGAVGEGTRHGNFSRRVYIYEFRAIRFHNPLMRHTIHNEIVRTGRFARCAEIGDIRLVIFPGFGTPHEGIVGLILRNIINAADLLCRAHVDQHLFGEMDQVLRGPEQDFPLALLVRGAVLVRADRHDAVAAVLHREDDRVLHALRTDGVFGRDRRFREEDAVIPVHRSEVLPVGAAREVNGPRESVGIAVGLGFPGVNEDLFAARIVLRERGNGGGCEESGGAEYRACETEGSHLALLVKRGGC